jgi:hypothetical protein
MLQRTLQAEIPLTATHDHIMAWSGLGSALATLYQQLSIPASVIKTALICGYFTNILALHFTTPLLFSTQSYNSSITVITPIQGLAESNGTASLK